MATILEDVQMLITRGVFISLIFIFSIGALTAACSRGGENSPGEPAMAPLAQMPLQVQRASYATRQAYQFAVANPEIMTQLPCFCGCGGMGHTSNHSCFVAGMAESGAITYDGHALGCSICVDIALDAMRLFKQGKSLQDIRPYIYMVYGQYGPSNM
jgi:hypothetical protein